MKVLIYQLKVETDKNDNFKKVEKIFENYVEKENIDMVILPECWNSKYGIKYFEKNAEVLKDEINFELDSIENYPFTYLFLENLSKTYPNTYIIAGTIPEKKGDKIYNSCPIFYQGQLVDIYRKINLYDINIPGFEFYESKVLTPGDKPVSITTQYGNIGFGICFDLRFPNLAEYYRDQDCNLIIYPGAFNMKTGELHWELLQRARALDNKCYVIGCSIANDSNAEFKAWGESMIVDPWGKVIKKLGKDEDILISELDFNVNKEIKQMIPTFLTN